jgi:Zn-dependent M28 family amino/carboxypeptidase
VASEPITVNNVVGIMAGREPERDEMVVVGAHLDHDGIDADGRIYNGADDNASGTAAVLTAAAAFARAAQAGERPARAIVFALWNGEEKGSLGAESFAAAPQPPGEVVANINLDMVGRPAPEGAQVVHLLGYTYSADLARIASAAGEGLGLDIREDYDTDTQNLVQRSDNWAFLKRGVPAIFFTTGLHPDYHTPNDDADKIDYAKLERITKLASRTAWVAADGAAPRFMRRGDARR